MTAPDSQPQVVIEFNEAVINVDISDFVLSRNGQPANDLLLDGQWLSEVRYQLNLSSAYDANFELKLEALVSDIQDLAGNSIAQDAAITWNIDRQSPTWNVEFTPAMTPLPRLHRVAALGDSMTLESTGSYVQFLRHQFSSANLEVQTFAGSGWKADKIRQVWETEVRDAGFDTIIVFSGLADLSSASAGADKIFGSLKGIYDDAIAHGINVICINTTPWADYWKWTRDAQVSTQVLNSRIKDYVTLNPQYMRLVNAYDRFRNTDDEFRLQPRYGIGDGAHFSSVGDRYLAELVTPVLAGLMKVPPVNQSFWLQFSEPVTDLLAGQVTVRLDDFQFFPQLTRLSPDLYQFDFVVPGDKATSLSVNVDPLTVSDLAGNLLTNQPRQDFNIDYQAPSAVLTIDQVRASNLQVNEITLALSEDVTGVSLANFKLLKEGVAVDLSSAQLEVIDPQHYRLNVSQLAGVDGNYEIVFVPTATTVDLAGNSFFRGSLLNWVTLREAPRVDAGVLYLADTHYQDTLEVMVETEDILWYIGGIRTRIRHQGITRVEVATDTGNDYVSLAVWTSSLPIVVSANSSDNADIVFMYDSTLVDQWQVDSNVATLTNTVFQLVASGFAQTTAIARSLSDRATLVDSVGNDVLDSRGRNTTLKSGSFSYTASGFSQTTVQSLRGGTDTAEFFDTIYNDVAALTPSEATLTAAGYATTAKNFSRVSLRASAGNDKAILTGTSSIEKFVGQATNSYWTGTGFTYYLYSFDEVQVTGGGGNDQVTLYDSPGNDRLESTASTATLILPTVRLTAINIPRTNVYARTGDDTATFTGRSTAETFSGQPTVSSLSADGYSVYAYAFDTVTAIGQGGNDTAKLYDSTSNDLFESRPQVGKLSGPGYRIEVYLYRRVDAYARGGIDRAEMRGGFAAEALTGQPTNVTFSGPDYTAVANGFDWVEAIGDASDTAKLYDSLGNDTFEAGGQLAYMYGATYNNQVSKFGKVTAYARTGNDTANFHGTSGADKFTGRSTVSSLMGVGYANYAYTFDMVIARGGGVGDTAFLYDSAGNDEFVGSSTISDMRGTGYEVLVQDFPRISAYATSGQDTARLIGTLENDAYLSRPEYASLKGTQYFLLASGFDSVTTEGRGGNDTAVFYDSAGDDSAIAGANQAGMQGPGYSYLAQGFGQVTFVASSGLDSVRLSDTAGDDTFTGQGTSGRLVATGLSVSLSNFDTVELANSTQGLDRIISRQLQYVLSVGLGWVV